MGIISSRDTRRISFDNTFTLSNSALTIQKSIEDENILRYDSLIAKTSSDLLYKGNNKVETQEDNEVDYWSNRIEHLKKEHQTINKIIETEYDEKIESTNKFCETPKITHEKIQKIKPCFDCRAKILKCYEENPRQALRCWAVVQAFNQCVSSCRIED